MQTPMEAAHSIAEKEPMTQAQRQQVAQFPRTAIVTLLLVAAMAVGIVSGIALSGTSLFGGLADDDAGYTIDPAVLLSGLEWEREREQQRMFGDTIPPGWFQNAGN
jgi:hypothetical protein